jgi:sarcosine oxidase delta subunit
MRDTSRPHFKTDGSQWYNYFMIRQNDEGHFYFAWISSRQEAFPNKCFKCTANAKEWILGFNWKEAIDEEFEREVLS